MEMVRKSYPRLYLASFTKSAKLGCLLNTITCPRAYREYDYFFNGCLKATPFCREECIYVYLHTYTSCVFAERVDACLQSNSSLCILYT